MPVTNLVEFVELARKSPGKINLGHAGVGSSNYLICRNFMQAAGVDVTLVSYRGASLAPNDLFGGQIDAVCDAATSLLGAVQSNEVKALVVATPARLAILPEVPTSTEAGLPAFQAQGWNALFAPKGTPEPVIARLNEALRTALASELVQKRFFELATVAPSAEELTPAYLAQHVPREVEKYRVLLTAK